MTTKDHHPAEAPLALDERDDSELLRLRFAMGERLKLADLRGRVEKCADAMDCLIHLMSLPVPDELHMKALRGALPELLSELRAALEGSA